MRWLGPASCKIALTPASARALRRASSSVAPSVPGRAATAATYCCAARAVTSELTPPGGAATWQASPRPGGRSKSADLAGASALSVLAPGAGRLEVNSSEPSGRNSGPDSPSADRVSRAGGAPLVSIRQMLVTYLLGSGPRLCTTAASQLP